MKYITIALISISILWLGSCKGPEETTTTKDIVSNTSTEDQKKESETVQDVPTDEEEIVEVDLEPTKAQLAAASQLCSCIGKETMTNINAMRKVGAKYGYDSAEYTAEVTKRSQEDPASALKAKNCMAAYKTTAAGFGTDEVVVQQMNKALASKCPEMNLFLNRIN